MRGKVSACFVKNTNSEEYSESHIKLVFLLSFSLIGNFSTVYIHGRLSGRDHTHHRWLLEQILESQAAIGKPEKASCSWLLEGFSQLLTDFIKESRNFILDVLHK
jgi:hypothetical protein